MPEFLASTLIHAPIEAVWDFHASPGAFESLTPPWQGARVLSRSGGIEAGGELWVSVRLLGPICVKWHALHTICAPPTLFVDEQAEGPFAYWRHEHRFTAHHGRTTMLTDAITYRLPGGSLVDRCLEPFVRSQLRRLFDYRHKTTRKSCE